MAHSDAKLAVDLNSQAIQVLELGVTSTDTVTNTTANTALPTLAGVNDVVRISLNIDTYIAFGTSGVTATSSSHLFPVGVEYVTVPKGATHIAYLAVGIAGRISITHML